MTPRTPLYRTWDVAFIRWYTALKREFGYLTAEQRAQFERWQWLQNWKRGERPK